MTNLRDSYLESRILSADAVELTRILYEAALEAVERARQHVRKRDIAARSSQITRAMLILTELALALNHDIDPGLSRTMAELYDYMQRRLIEANAQQVEPPLAEVSQLLQTLLDAWVTARNASAEPAAEPSQRDAAGVEAEYAQPTLSVCG
jgi:flagellar protein FliS